MSERVQRILAAIAALSEEERRQLFEYLGEEIDLTSASQAALPLKLESSLPEGSADYTLVFDGGSQGNPGPGYGSYALIKGRRGKPRPVPAPLPGA